MSVKESAEVSINKESFFLCVGILCDMMIDFEDGVQLHLDENDEIDDDDESNDYADLLLSVLALLCEPFRDNLELFEACNNYTYLHCGVTIDDIIFGDEDKIVDTNTPHLTLVLDNDDDEDDNSP